MITVKLPAGYCYHPDIEIVTFLLSDVEVQVTGRLVPFVRINWHTLVATVIPLNTILIFPFANKGFWVPKTIVQIVF